MTATLIAQSHRTRRTTRARTTYFPFEFGWNIVDPSIELKPGVMLDGENYEVHYRSGYGRIKGYERSDGTGLPSAETYALLPYDQGSTEPEVGDVVTGADSGATGTIAVQLDPDSGAFGTSDAAGNMVLWGVSGTFQDNENLQISAATVAVSNGTQDEEGELDDDLHNTYLRAAIEARRSSIEKVPGAGPVRGYWKYKGDYYAFRDNTQQNQCGMYQETTAGWVEQDLGETLNFDQTGVAIPFNSGSTEPSVGDTLSGATSGETGDVLAVYLASGTWAGGDAAGYLILTNLSDDFNTSENIDNDTASAANVATTNGTTLHTHEIFEGASVTGQISGATATVGRIIVQAGDWSTEDAEGYLVLRDVMGSFQDNEAITSDCIRLPFTSGSIEPSVGDVLEGASSGAQGTVVELLPLDSGTWDGFDADSQFVLSGVTGTFGSSESVDNTTASESGIATTDDVPNDIGVVAGGVNISTVLEPGGRYEFVNHNFGGHQDSRRVYGCDGVNNGFEWDGTTYVPIRTGMVDDTPIFVQVHKQHLFFTFSGGSLQHSSTGIPLVWSPVTGASELAIGEDITGLVVEVGDVLAVFTRSETYMLYGNNSSDWDLQRFHQGSGAIKYTAQKMGVAWMMDDEGVSTLQASQAYGDFLQSTVTSHIQPYIDTVVGAGAKRNIQGSIRVRKKNQYRLYFDDMTGLTITIENNKIKGAAKSSLSHQFNAMYSVKDDDEGEGAESEVLLAGGNDGYAYRIDSGTSFDGESIQAWFFPNFHHFRMPLHNKIVRGLLFELDVQSVGSISIFPEFDYGSGDTPSSLENVLSLLGHGGRWNVDDWNDFFWSAPLFQQVRLRVDGWGKNMAFLVVSNSTYEEPHTFQGVSVEYAQRRLVR